MSKDTDREAKAIPVKNSKNAGLFQPGKSGNPNGRKKGQPNKLTKSAKEAYLHAFDELGGAQGLAIWARDNLTEFYKLHARLIPTDTTVKIDGMELVRESAAKIRADEKSAGGYPLEKSKKSGK